MTVRGLVVGKFLPPHRGHHLLVDEAASRCDELTVVVSARSVEPIAVDRRVGWLRDRHPGVRVVGFVDDHPVDFDDDATWQHWADRFASAFATAHDGPAPIGPDVLFTSEPYGEELARRIGCRHESIDPARVAVPVSGTLVRDDPLAASAWLEPAVRAHFVRRVVLIGAESTGKTTLAARLAERLNTTWVPERGRAHSEERAARGEGEWRTEEFVAIGTRQQADEDLAAQDAHRVLICDTDALATVVWHARYVGGETPAELLAVVDAHPHDLYLLSVVSGTAWVDDGLRDGEHRRHEMEADVRRELARRERPMVELTGTWAEREATALAAIAALDATPWSGRAYRPEEPGDRSRRFA